jgi:hypothetical protein
MIQMKNARCTFSSIEPATPYEEQVTPANLSTMCLTYCFSAHGDHKRSRARLCWRRSPPAWSFLQEWSSGSSWQGDGGGHYEFVAAVKRSPRLCHCAVGWGEGGDTTKSMWIQFDFVKAFVRNFCIWHSFSLLNTFLGVPKLQIFRRKN